MISILKITVKKDWFFKNFLKDRNNIQDKFYNYLQKQKVQILFYNWLEDYASAGNKINLSLSKTSNPITNRCMTLVKIQRIATTKLWL